MTKKSNLEKINLNVKDGFKLKAVIQLGSLIDQNPDDLELRNHLATIYYEAGFLDAAGKFWLLSDSKESYIRNCVELYEKSKNYSGNKILQELKFKGDQLKLGEYPKDKLMQLENDSLKKTNYIPSFKPKAKVQSIQKETANSYKTKLGHAIFNGILIFLLISIVVGVKTIFAWLF